MDDTRFAQPVNRLPTGCEGDTSPRSLPHNIEAEQALLGAILLNNGLLEKVADTLSPESFYDAMHGAIYAETSRMIAAGRTANAITMRTTFETWEPISDAMTVPQYLGRLMANATSFDVKPYAQLIADLAMRRQVVVLAEEMMATAMDAPSDARGTDIIEEAERGLFEIVSRRADGREVAIDDAVDKALSSFADAYARGGELVGVATGLVDLDRMMGGLCPSDLIILAGRPSMGKTALATKIAYNVARQSKKDKDGNLHPIHVHFFSMEMSSDQLASRVIADESSMSSMALRRGNVSEEQFREVSNHAQSVKRASLTIDETGGITLASLAAKARRMKRRKGTGLIVIDYLQLMGAAAGKRGQNRVQEITEITMGLKALAKELDVPIIALSQLSRQVETRADKRPQLSDLRESGSIEQDADVVMFVFREEYYVERERPDESDNVKYSEWQGRMTRSIGKAEVILGKQRHGPVGTVMLSFESTYTRFGNLGVVHHAT